MNVSHARLGNTGEVVPHDKPPRSETQLLPAHKRKPAMSAMNQVSVSNRLLGRLPDKDCRKFLSGCEQVEVSFAQVLCEPAAHIRYVYFPTTAVVSLVIPVNSHAHLEVELVGNEGMVGVPLILGVDVSPLQTLVQGAGTALRMSAKLFRQELTASAALQRILHRYIYVSLAQLAQTAACNRFHALDARLAHWLLMTQDRTHSNEFHLTQEMLGKMLGVRRVGVTNAAGLLQKQNLVSYRRGNVKILDRAGLEAVSCGCYRAGKDMYQSIFG